MKRIPHGGRDGADAANVRMSAICATITGRGKSVSLEIQTGDPPEPGRYVVWTPCKAISARQWCEPNIATWHGGKWHTFDPVWGWIGPLPLCNAAPPLAAQEFKREYVGFDPASPDGDRSARVTIDRESGTIIDVEYDL